MEKPERMALEAPSPRRVLVLYCYHQAMRPAIRQHLHVLDASRNRHQIIYHNVADGVPGYLRRTTFDVVILHTTLLCYRWSATFPGIRKALSWLSGCPGLKIAMPQDEYDHAWVLDEWLSRLRVDIVFTQFDEEYREQGDQAAHSSRQSSFR